MMDSGNGLTSWFVCFWRNKLTMFRAHCPVNSLTQLAESKVNMNPTKTELSGSGHFWNCRMGYPRMTPSLGCLHGWMRSNSKQVLSVGWEEEAK
jgi:hypothetical protein